MSCDRHMIFSINRFVTKSDITEYVSPDQLLIQFGGTDTWTYHYNQGELKAQADEVWGHDPLIIEDIDIDNDEDDVEESIKQVNLRNCTKLHVLYKLLYMIVLYYDLYE